MVLFENMDGACMEYAWFLSKILKVLVRELYQKTPQGFLSKLSKLSVNILYCQYWPLSIWFIEHGPEQQPSLIHYSLSRNLMQAIAMT